MPCKTSRLSVASVPDRSTAQVHGQSSLSLEGYFPFGHAHLMLVCRRNGSLVVGNLLQKARHSWKCKCLAQCFISSIAIKMCNQCHLFKKIMCRIANYSSNETCAVTCIYFLVSHKDEYLDVLIFVWILCYLTAPFQLQMPFSICRRKMTKMIGNGDQVRI